MREKRAGKAKGLSGPSLSAQGPGPAFMYAARYFDHILLGCRNIDRVPSSARPNVFSMQTLRGCFSFRKQHTLFAYTADMEPTSDTNKETADAMKFCTAY